MTPLLARLSQFLMDLPLRTAIAVALIIGLVLPASLVAWRDVSVRRETLFDTLAEDHVRIVETLAKGMQAPIWDVRPDAAKPLIDVIMTDSRITAVSVSAPVLTATLVAGAPNSGEKGLLALERPVIRNGDPIGTVRVEMTSAPDRKSVV